MNFYNLYPSHIHRPTALSTVTHWQRGDGHFLPPLHSVLHQPLPLGAPPYTDQVEHHHYYTPSPLYLSYPWWCNLHPSPHLPVIDNHPLNKVPRHLVPKSTAWTEGSSLRGALRWGRLERVYGLRRELPEFVVEDLRRVYGTYPSTDVTISYQGGEFVVQAEPRVGQQEYRVEKKVVRQLESPTAEDGASEIAKRKKKKRKRGK